jgi:hypothetical protein
MNLLIISFFVGLSVSQAAAICLPTDFDDRSVSLTDRIIAYGNCVKKEEQARIGKYFCYVSHMVGVQKNADGTTYHGDIKPSKLFCREFHFIFVH